jgi:hypothetical protein
MPEALGLHPLRWKQTRPFADKAIQWTSVAAKNGLFTASGPQQAANWLVPIYNEKISRLPFEKRPADSRGMMRELNLIFYASRFFTMGRNIFTLSPGLAQSLRHTNLDGVRVDDVKMPHRFFYMSLDGMGCGSLPGSPNVIDGAYIDATIPSVIQIVITSRRLDCSPRTSKTWPLNRDTYFYFTRNLKEGENPTFQEVFEEAVLHGDIKVDTISEMPAENEMVTAGMEIFNEDSSDPRVIEWRNDRERNDRIEAVENGAAIESITSALSAVINALAWLSSEPDEPDLENGWTEGAPKNLVNDVMTGSKSVRKSAEYALLRQGFNRIKILGHKIRIIDHEATDGTGELRNAHWRIGHWRRQPHGPENTLRRLVWIRPVLVRSDLSLPSDSGGHEYVLGT